MIRLRQYLDDRLGGQAAEALHRGRLVLVAIENLWDRCRPELVRLREQGVQAAATWRDEE